MPSLLPEAATVVLDHHSDGACVVLVQNRGKEAILDLQMSPDTCCDDDGASEMVRNALRELHQQLGAWLTVQGPILRKDERL